MEYYLVIWAILYVVNLILVCGIEKYETGYVSIGRFLAFLFVSLFGPIMTVISVIVMIGLVYCYVVDNSIKIHNFLERKLF